VIKVESASGTTEHEPKLLPEQGFCGPMNRRPWWYGLIGVSLGKTC